jgi:hypothetical protein
LDELELGGYIKASLICIKHFHEMSKVLTEKVILPCIIVIKYRVKD